MGAIDAIFITDGKDNLVFEHYITTSTPSLQYVLAQLNTVKREIASNEGLDLNASQSSLTSSSNIRSSDYSQSVFESNGGISLDSIIRLDSKWNVAWEKVDAMHFIMLGEIASENTDVVSEDEDDDDEEDSSSADEGTTTLMSKNPEYESFGDEGEEGEEVEAADRTDDSSNKLHNKSKPVTTSAKISNPANPLQYFHFVSEFIEIVKMFLNTTRLNSQKIQNNSHTIMLILQEMIDASFPYITDLNQLRELLPNNSIIHKILSTTKQLQNTATNSLNSIAQSSSIMPSSSRDFSPNGIGQRSNSPSSSGQLLTTSIFEKSGYETPWRKVNVKHTQNEMLVDLKERINWILPSSKPSKQDLPNVSSYYNTQFKSSKSNSKKYQPVLATIDGEIEFRSSLSSMPTVELMLNLHNHDLAIPSFHKCVDVERWIARPGALSFIPPDEKFILMKYHLNLLDDEEASSGNIWSYIGLVDCELVTGLGVKKNEFEIKLQTKLLNSVKSIDDLIVEVFLPDVNSGESVDYFNKDDDDSENGSYSIRTLRITHGDFEMKGNNRFEWKFEKALATGLNCTFKGAIVFDDEIENDDDGTASPAPKSIRKPKFIRISYTNRGSIPSMIKADSLKVVRGLNSAVKPYKGVKYITETGDFTLR
ncbi:hypothetical protein CANARDRAFT_29723 [[Candida] arabinofermentans NRRL YB-2248]|uniref:MHD domain-containing protein n=1 Tax=[Candida] arabinofermentans NRRL YB-2248 TaxID=983967 RepID=A0A1E4SW59_9ASCO|nr:hypothetical protein CANARDRAFT_29723 [[Candida] arabinofermentans NRRL YB-2248]